MSEINFHDYFYYDETSPSCLRWRVDRYFGNSDSTTLVKAGDAVATVNHAKYYIGTLFRKVYRVHRIIWTLFNGTIPEGALIDHIDRNKQNNKIGNLRLATTSSNGQNCIKQSNNTSGVTGVDAYKYKDKVLGWRAGWQENGKWHTKNFSFFANGDQAFAAACAFRKSQIARMNESGANYTELHGT